MDERLKNKIALIVDDDERNTFALSSYLREMDMKIETATNGEIAISLLLQGLKADIVLLDMMMPVMDGYETLAAMKSNDLLKEIPVIAVTARAMKGDKEKCIEAGASDYVSKPIDMQALIEKIMRLTE
jgi:two-component system chemotaxis sensor kinase CheA